MSDAHNPETIDLHVLRQEAAERPESQRWDRFRVRLTPRMTIAAALFAIERDPLTIDGRAVAPVVWEASCRPRACACCALNANGHVRIACSSLLRDVSPKGKAVKLTPLGSFALIRDLLVDRTRMADAARRLHAWSTPSETTTTPSSAQARAQLSLSRCTLCGACVEACPETSAGGGFVGAAAIAGNELAARYGGADPATTSAALLQDGALEGCERSFNCLAVCPEGLPLDDAIGDAARRATRRWLLRR
jgi:succinate dehydrogenase / fumarate reductase iron-sulfur subunit